MNSQKNPTLQNKISTSVKFGGPAGFGIKSVGLILAKQAVRSGYHIYDQIEYPSLIRGGHNAMQVHFSAKPVTAPKKTLNLLVALNGETIKLHSSEMEPDGSIIYNSDDQAAAKQAEAESKTPGIPGKNQITMLGIPLSALAQQAGDKTLYLNIVAIGAVIGLFGGNLEILKTLIEEEFSHKTPEVVEGNKKAAQSGYSYVIENFPSKLSKALTPIDSESVTSFTPHMVVTGCEAAALGSIAAGVQFASIYPMSPVSNIMHLLAAHQEKFGYIFKQVEDEIAAINMAIGASFAGARSMTTTSGGGFCLMTEGYGLAGMTETPVVIIDGMRGGPATGLPTWSEQGDLLFALHAHQSNFPKIVLAAGDVQETYDLTLQAFNLADIYQTPVMLLLDKNICENDQSVPFLGISGFTIDRGKFLSKPYTSDQEKSESENYKRYKIEPDGISLRTIPGTGNYFLANSDEHNEYGYSSEEIEDRNAQMQKRMRKLETCAKVHMQVPTLYGPEKADITLVSWGSTKGSILQALDYMNTQHGPKVNYLHITWLSPFPAEAVKQRLSKAKKLVAVECNYSGQLAQVIKVETGIDIINKFLKYDGRQIYSEDLVEYLSSLNKKGGN